MLWLRVVSLDADELPWESREAFRTCMATLRKLAERLTLEAVGMNFNGNVHFECLAEEPGKINHSDGP